MSTSSGKAASLISKDDVDTLVDSWLSQMSHGKTYKDPKFTLPELTPRASAYCSIVILCEFHIRQCSSCRVGLGAEQTHSRLMTIMEPVDKKLKKGIQRDKQRVDELNELNTRGKKRFRGDESDSEDEAKSK